MPKSNENKARLSRMEIRAIVNESLTDEEIELLLKEVQANREWQKKVSLNRKSILLAAKRPSTSKQMERVKRYRKKQQSRYPYIATKEG